MADERRSGISEDEYVTQLEHERHMYAWCLVAYGDFTPEAAARKALDFYEYEPPRAEYRDLVFHDEAWHWAMLRVLGEGYWRAHPERAQASEAYRVESLRWVRSHAQ